MASISTAEEISPIRTAVMSTFCKGNRRARIIKLVMKAEMRSNASAQAVPGELVRPKESRTSLSAQASRKRIKEGFCHGSSDGDGEAENGLGPAMGSGRLDLFDNPPIDIQALAEEQLHGPDQHFGFQVLPGGDDGFE